ncbi:MAG: hypothetical protein HVK29_04380 [Pelagibacteraceae bacterium]|nr:hypothetical protein [Pelagibacteraceae bacterium]
MRKKKALNERLAWTGTHSRYKENIKKKKKKKVNNIWIGVLIAFVIALGAYLISKGFFG